MMRSLTAAISGLRNYQAQMDVIGNNIANVNTVGFKSARSDFADSFSQTMRESSAGSGGTGAVSAMQVGLGVNMSAIKNEFGAGSMTGTAVKSDLAIDKPEGFFIVNDPVSREQFVTRAGNFRVDGQGYLVTNSGQRLQGYVQGTSGTVGDLQIDDLWGKPPNSLTANLVSWAIDTEGRINVSLSDGVSYVRGQILLERFTDPQGLVKRGNNLYSGMAAAGASSPLPPGSSGMGKIQSGMLEQSNVDLGVEFSTMITAQRAFQATARIITTSDEMLQELVNLKR